MTTSLAAQLKKLAVPQTSLLERDKKRPSLLFDSKEAAAIDRDTFYDIGISGLRDLKALDGDFAYFENNLFSSTSRTVERAVQDKETNKNLDKTIKKFFILLSPYFLLKPAHKALEWLIQRFSIHEYNKNDFLKLIFPYHETNIFVRCLRLFNFKNKTDGWNWLYPLQKSGVHLPKITLYNHCASDVGFITLINKMVLEAVKEKKSNANSLTTLFTFYSTTTIGTLENVHEVSEPLLTAILPALLNGLLSDVPDYVASTYMITAVLLKKTQLSHKLLNTLVARLSNNEQKLLRMEATLVLLLVYQAQKDHYTMVTDKVARNLVNADWFASNVNALAASGSYVLPLLSPVLRAALLKNRADKYRRLTEKLFNEIHLNDSSVDTLIRIVLDSCPTSEIHDTSSEEEDQSDSESASSIPAVEWYASFLKQLETQYPNAFDKIVREVLSGKTSTSQRQAEALKHIMTFAMSKTKNSRYTIFEKLYHPNADFRKAAVEFLVKNFNSLSLKDKEMLQGAINERILDEDCRVIRSILKLQHNDLVDLLGRNNFIPIAVKLLINGIQDDKYSEIIPYLIKHVCYGEISKDASLLLPILPLLFPVDEKELNISMKILQTDFSQHYEFLTVTKNQNKTFKTPKKFCETIYQNLLKYNTNFEITKLPNDILNIHKYLGCILIASNLPKISSADVALKALQQISSYLGQCKVMKLKGFNVAECITYTRKEYLSLEGFLECVKIILTKTECSEIPSSWLPLFSTNQTVCFLIKMLELVVKGCHHDDKITVKYYSVLFKIFMEKFFKSFRQKVHFLVNFLLCDENTNNIINTKTQLRIIRILNSVLSLTQKEPLLWIVEFSNTVVVPAILIGLINPIQEVRMAVFEIVYRLSILNCKNINESYIPLLQKLLKHKQEIVLDSDQLPLILCTLPEESTAKKSINVLYNIISEVNLPLHVNSKLLKILTFINSNEMFEKSAKVAMHVLKTADNKNIILDFHQSCIVYNVILRFNEATASGMKLGSCSLEFLNLALQQDLVSLEYEQNKYSCPSVLILDQINRDIFNKLSLDVQNELIKILTNIATISENPDVVSCTYKIVKKLDLDAKLLIDMLTIMKDVKSLKNNVPQRKFRRVSVIPTADILDMIEWKRGITVLEFIQDKKMLTNLNLLLPVLFAILKKCLDFDEQAAVEYPKQIILTAILYICNRMETEGTKINQICSSFNMELVVQCIRASQNPQTHHHALLLLAHTAALLPDQVLHNIMAIFTFMGSSVLRHDDSYSFQIISKIIDTVIPILVHQDNTDRVASVLRVFVDVVLDIPEHRRLPLFKKLLVTLGVEEYMWLFLLLIFESHVIHGNNVTSKETSNNRLLINAESTTKRLDIASNITLEFEPSVVISTTIKLLEYLKSLPNEIDDNMMDVDNTLTFNIKQRTPKQFRHYKYTLVKFLSGILSSQQLVNRIAVLNNEELLDLEPSCKNMIINTLTYIQTVSKIVDRTSNSPQAQYWKVMLHHCFDIMDSINALLTSEMFLLVIRGLIVHNIPTVKRKAMEILNTKLQHQPSFFYSSQDDEDIIHAEGLFALIPSLLNIIKSVEHKDVESEQELTQQTALLSLKLLIKLLATKHPDQFTPMLNYVTDLMKSNVVSSNILASVVLCLAELCSKLRAHAIPGLVRYMPALIKVLKAQKLQETPGLLLMCILTAIQKIVESLPLFMSPYLQKILCELAILSVKWPDEKSTPFEKKLESIRSNIGTMIPARILIPIVGQTYSMLLNSEEFLAVGPLMSILAENLSHLRGAELTNHLSDLTTFFLNALQFRTDYNGVVNFEIITRVEDHLIQALTVLVLKLSETTFRPFYYRLFDWAVHNDSKSERVITFYRLSCGFAENLKGLFVLFAGHFVTNAASLLDSCNTVKSDTLYFNDDESKNILLIESILSTLKSVFSYDSQQFVDKDRFETLMQPIVDQLENTITNTTVENILIPCISQFAVATADDALWKQLNYQILLKMRHNFSQIRLAALNCLCEVARKLGEDFLPLLPETIPFLAELLEDEDEQVETRCQKVVQDLEKSLGEPLQKYF